MDFYLKSNCCILYTVFNHLQFSSVNNQSPVPLSHYNPLEEPSPLGLRLRKSPSLLELIEMRLSQGKSSTLGSAPTDDSKSREKSNLKSSALTATDKLKASNFPASILKIGSWEVNEFAFPL